MREVRSAVTNGYNWDKDRVKLMQTLLDQDNFVAPDIQQVCLIHLEPFSREYSFTKMDKPGKRRFLSSIIAKVIHECLFSNPSRLGMDCTTQHMFNPLRGETVVWFCDLIRHAIEEKGNRQVNKLDAKLERSKYSAFYI
jgi:hypothetical protein